jgi:hypothetical protein
MAGGAIMTTVWNRVSTAVGVYLYRLGGAAVLDAGMYESLEADHSVTRQALLTVVLSSVAAGIGAGTLYGDRLATFTLVAGIAVATWAAWSMLTLQIGTRLLAAPRTEATWGQLLRTTGFAAVPGFLQVFAVFPGARIPIFAATGLWMFTAMVVAVRHALDYRSTGRALVVCAIAAAISAALAFGFGLVAGTAVS